MSPLSPGTSTKPRKGLLAAPLTRSDDEKQGRGQRGKVVRRLAIYLALGGLLYVALRNVPLPDIWEALGQLRVSQLALILLINALVIVSITARWWIIVRAENAAVPFLSLVGYRLSVFGLSYFTPGPQVGGEPLQVFYLQRNHGISFARATSAVIMDKLLEFLANFILIGAGLTAAARVGLLSRTSTQVSWSLIPLAVVLAWPLVHLVLLYHGRYPMGSLLRSLAPVVGSRAWMRLIMVAERMAASFTRRRPGSVLMALGFSLLAWGGMALEYFLIASFLSARLSFEQTLAALTAALVAFLMPLPGGLGALEASQVYALETLGYAPAIGISISLIMRGRDIINGTIGLVLAGRQTKKRRLESEISSVS